MMKIFYRLMLLLLLGQAGGFTSLAQTKNGTYLGTTASLGTAYRAKIKTTNAVGSLNKISHKLPGVGLLELTVLNTRKETGAEVFMGQVGKGRNDYFFMKIAGNTLSGYIILKNTKKAFEYTSTAKGSAYLKEVNIDKVLCVNYKEAKMNRSFSGSHTNSTTVVDVIPSLQSLPGATAVIYLDFDGQKVSNSNWNGGRTIDAQPANLNQDEIINVWKLISEDYRPFTLNITTSENVFNNAPVNRRMRVIFTPTDDAGPGYGGVAYVGSFGWSSETPCWVFNEGIKGAGEAGSHEIGHTFGLGHDGRVVPSEEYFGGQDTWAPIMGIGYNVDQVQWSKGEYSQANNTENDLAIITTQNGFSYRSDDHGNTNDNATPLISNSSGDISTTSNKGIITTQSDIDVFSFTAGNGAIALNVDPNPDYPNLDIQLTLKNSEGTTVATSDPEDMSASLTPFLSPGKYYLCVAGGKGLLGANSDYGSLGEYSISGNVSSSYCTPVITSGCGGGDYINNFSFNTLVNNNSGCNGQVNAYINYSPSGTHTTNVARGQSYTLKVQSGIEFSQGFGVWLDYNNDKDFNDAGEFIYSSPSAEAGKLYSATITIPSNATTGQRRLRVRGQYFNTISGNQACEPFEHGETEDYTVTIINAASTAYWDRRFGGSGVEGFTEVIKTTDGGYLLSGYSASGINGDKTQASRGRNDFWILKTDASGNRQWDQRYGGAGDEFLNAVIQTSDGGYLLAGSSESGTGGDKSQAARGGRDYWVVKVSGSGAKQWDKRFGGTGYEDLRKVVQLSTGEYMLAGYSDSPANGDKSQASKGGRDYWLIKINSAGTKIWDKCYGGSAADNLESMVVNPDGKVLLGGSSLSGNSGDKSQASRGRQDYWIVQTDKNGAILWDKQFGGSADDQLFSMLRLSSGEYLLAGTSASGISGDKSQSSQGGKDYWMLKISATGAKLWDKRFGGSGDDELRSLILTADGGFMLGGKSVSGISGDKSQSSHGSSDYWLMKVTSSGSEQWDRRFGGSGAEELRSIIITSENDYLLGGRSESGLSGDKTQSSRGGSDYWLIKINSNGLSARALATKTAAAPTIAGEQEVSPTKSEAQWRVYPNPFADKVNIDFMAPDDQHIQVQVFDSYGQLIKTLHEGFIKAGTIQKLNWQPSLKQQSGIYVIQVITQTKVYQHKIMLSR